MTAFYDLDAAEEYARELGFGVSRLSEDELSIMIGDVTLRYLNLRSDSDTVAGIEGGASHWHGPLILGLGDRWIKLDELDVLKGIKSGELLLFERYTNSVLVDRWLIHEKEMMDHKFMASVAEERVRRLV